MDMKAKSTIKGIEIFVSYAHEDEILRDQLLKQWRESERQGIVYIWHDRDISAGKEREQEIDEHLNSAQIILLLISPDFMNSDYCNSFELQHALEKHEAGTARVIPILLRPTLWEDAPFGKLQVLPKNEKPITLWTNRDLAFLEVARGIREVVDELKTDMQSESKHYSHKSINPLPKFIDKRRFKNRNDQRTTILTLLSGNARLISVYGIGGVGKTALVCRVLGDLRASGDCPYDMIYLSTTSTGISLDRIFADFGKLLTGNAKVAISNAWRNQQMSVVQKVTELLDQLRQKRYILLLDSLETLQNAETYELIDPDMRLFLETVLEQESMLQIIITSRFPLILPFPLKSKEQSISLEEGLPEKHAIALLRALDPKNEAGLQKAPQLVLRGFVTSTRGFPLALVTIAGFLLTKKKLLGPGDLLKDKVLFSTNIIESIVEQLLIQLNPGMIRVMEALALFDQPVDRNAIEFLLVPYYIEPRILHASLDQLVLAYFIDCNKETQTFTLHPIVSAYCYNRIPEGLPDDIQAGPQPPYTRYALHYRAAQFYKSQHKPYAEWLSFSDLAAQFAEFEHLVRAGDYDTAAELIGTVDYDYLFKWGYFRRVLVMRERLIGKIGNKELESSNLGVIGEVYRYLGDFQLAISYNLQALALDQEINNKSGQCRWLLCLGASYRNSGDEEKSVGYFQQGLIAAQELQDRFRESLFLTHLGFSQRTLGYYEQALDYYRKALDLGSALSHDPLQGCILVSMGIAHIGLGQHEQAEENVSRGIKICRQGHPRDKRWEGVGLGTLGLLYTEQGHYEQAILQHQQAVTITREIEDQFGESFDLTRLGKTFLAQGSYELAIKTLLLALEIAIKINNREILQEGRTALAQTYLQIKEYPKALETNEAACQQNFLLHNHRSFALHGVILLRLGQEKKAYAAFKEALGHVQTILARTPLFYTAKYTKGLALAGLALLSTGSKQAAFLTQSQDAYHAARDNCSLPGAIADAIRLLNELQLSDRDAVLTQVLETLVESPPEDQF
jgi:tetratricopeptide (TPR) repeat protein